AQAAGLGQVTFVPEPVAAAPYYSAVLGHQLPAGGALVVFDFGAGTFDASVVRRATGDAAWSAGDGRGADSWAARDVSGPGEVSRAETFRVVAVDGLDDVGGVDLDAAIVDWLRAGSPADSAAVWARLINPATAGDARERHLLWEDVRTGKEMLSRSAAVSLRLPLQDRDAPLTRQEFEQVAGPLVERTVRATAALVRHARLDTTEIAGLFLVGGSSRIPLVATALHRALGVGPAITEQPELVVAEGSLHSLPHQPSNRVAPARTPAAAVISTAGTRATDAVTAVDGVPVTDAVPSAPTATRSAPDAEYPLWREQRGDEQRYGQSGTPYDAAPRRGVAGRVTLAVVCTAVLLVAAGIASGVVKLPNLGGLGKPGNASTATGTRGAAPAVDPFVPAGWHPVVSDPLRSTGNWLSDTDPANASTCAVDGRLTVTKQTSGTYRCKGPTNSYDDEAVSADVTLVSQGVCGGIWFRFGPAAQTGHDAGYVLEVCHDRLVLAAHGLPDFTKVTEMQIFPATVELNVPARVGILARGTSLTVYLNGARAGQFTSAQFARGRTALGIFVPQPVTADHPEVAFSNIEIAKPDA
ncbi:MAG: molecular chaperone DnaK, partial [Micromonosporaceae bacterium]|nr:molecular chaperone DnaK [Micromonosporaceae bacterium]